MNAYAGGLAECGILDRPLEYGPQKLTHIQNPSRMYVFIDEHPDSLDFVSFWVEDRKSGGGLTGATGSCPSALHGGGAVVSFADGHVELHLWEDARTKPPVTYTNRLSFRFGSDGSADLRWLQERTQLHR